MKDNQAIRNCILGILMIEVLQLQDGCCVHTLILQLKEDLKIGLSTTQKKLKTNC